MKKRLIDYAAKKGFNINKDVLDVVVNKTEGKCPCKPGQRCPCRDHLEEILFMKSCHCGLFSKED